MPQEYHSENWDEEFASSSCVPDPDSVFRAGVTLEEMISWGAAARNESPLEELGGGAGLGSVKHGRSKGPLPVAQYEAKKQEDDAEDAFVVTGINEREKALTLIEQMRKRIGDVFVSQGSDEVEIDPRIACILDKLGECEEALIEKDRLSLVLLGRNGVGKSFLINVLLLLTSPSSNDYGYRRNIEMCSLFCEDFEEYKCSLQDELDAVIENRKVKSSSAKEKSNPGVMCLIRFVSRSP